MSLCQALSGLNQLSRGFLNLPRRRVRLELDLGKNLPGRGQSSLDVRQLGGRVLNSSPDAGDLPFEACPLCSDLL